MGGAGSGDRRSVCLRPPLVMWINSAFWREVVVIWTNISLFLRKISARVFMSVLFNRAKLGRI